MRQKPMWLLNAMARIREAAKFKVSYPPGGTFTDKPLPQDVERELRRAYEYGRKMAQKDAKA